MVKLFWKIVKLRFFALIEYPGSFLGGVTAQWMVYGIDMFMLVLMVGQFGTMAGWLPSEVLFFYAVWLLSYAIGASFTFNLSLDMPNMAINGTMDEALIRPMPALAYLIATKFNLGYVSHITLTVAALVYSILQLGVSWTAWQWVWFIVLIFAGAAIQGSLMLICEMPALRTRSASPTGVFYWETRQFVKYPITIYPRAIQFIFTTVLPFGFMNFYPLQVLLGNRDGGAFTEIAKWLSPAVAGLLLFITALCWKLTTRRYESAGT